MTIEQFLIKAKQNTYANGKALRVESNRQGSKDYHYEENIYGKKYIYHDTYFGGQKFMGEEVVYLDSERPCWGMNYYGFVIDKELTSVIFDDVLRPALMNVGQDKKVLPLRGVAKYKTGEYIYSFKTEGTIDNFIGVETITKNKKIVYQLNCHGGMIEK